MRTTVPAPTHATTATLRWTSFAATGLAPCISPPVRPWRRSPTTSLSIGATAQKRLVEHARTLYFKDDLTGPLPLDQLGPLGLTYEQYRLALTKDLLTAVFGSKLNDVVATGIGTAQDKLDAPTLSGYLSGADMRFAPKNTPGQYWMRSGVAGFASDAADHFYLPERYEDPFGNVTTLAYDGKYDLFIQSSTDPRGNRIEVTQFDYRVLAPREIKDMNGNCHRSVF